MYAYNPVPVRVLPGVLEPGLVAVGCNIYNIGGSDLRSMFKGNYSKVTKLECRSHTLREVASLPVGLYMLSASAIDGKIYTKMVIPLGRTRIGIGTIRGRFAVRRLRLKGAIGIWGKLEWLDHVLTAPVTSRLVKVLAATV